MAVLDSPQTVDVLGAICVGDFLRGRKSIAEAGVDGDHRLCVNFAAEVEELVDAKIVVFNARPGRILSRRPTITRPDAVAPIVPTDEVPAWPAIDRRIQ